MPDSFTIDPDGSRTRKLSKPILAHGGREISVIRLRPPKYRDIMNLGDPSALVVLSNAVLPSEDLTTVERYIETLAVDDAGAAIDPGLLEQIDYRDAIALKDAVVSFFKAASSASSTPPTP